MEPNRLVQFRSQTIFKDTWPEKLRIPQASIL